MLFLLLFAAGPPARVDFARDVSPILQAHCARCHGAKNPRGGLRLDSPVALRHAAIAPGKPGESEFLRRVAGVGKRMPPTGPPLSPVQVATLRRWVAQGAPWPDGPALVHWAYRPLVRPAVPVGTGRNPIDAFINARLGGLRAAPQADRRTLIRRLSFNLTGLPPAPEEVGAFLGDRRPDAYERLADRLLASPAHGERWARHWLDVVHFAETHGHDQDVVRENAWPYRDWVIRAFNEDLPYARFVRSQVAGDVLYPDDPSAVAALGMLAAGPWDESSQQSIRDDTVDKKQAQNLDRDDMVTTVFSAFCGTTVHCARCHDHKFDPISQKEHYALQAVFAGVDRANRAYEADPSVGRQRVRLEAERRRLLAAGQKELLSPEARAAVAAWAKGRAAWRVLKAAKVSAARGSKFRPLDDGSFLFEGPVPEVEITTVKADVGKGVRAVRLEVLTHPSLPKSGPGRQGNGNLHLNEFRAHDGRPVRVLQAAADFDQAGWTAAMAIDGNLATAWGIYPQVGRPHSIVFVLERAVAGEVAFTLEQTHGRQHLIGRMRLSVSESADTAALPPNIEAILNSPKRTPAQEAELTRHVLVSRIDARLAKLPRPGMVYAAAADFKPEGSFRPAKGCRAVHMLRRGDITKPAEQVAPAALSLLPGLPGELKMANPADEGHRRAALARWLSDGRNALTWRCVANRVWHYHFGRGLVRTPGDLGKMGALPTHPELLDWLACELRDSGGSLKRLHRLIVTSEAYRRASRHDAEAAKVDADNSLLWRFNRRRLEAEPLRDAALAVSGKLDRTMGGPSVREFNASRGIHVTLNVDYGAFEKGAAMRRAIYRFHFRTLPDPFFDALDCPDASQFAPVRAASVTALQALALYNGPFVVRQAENLAARVKAEAGDDPPAQVRRLWRLVLSRGPRPAELELMVPHVRRHGLASACRVLLNASEFVFVD